MSMTKYREILRLSGLGLSQQNIADSRSLIDFQSGAAETYSFCMMQIFCDSCWLAINRLKYTNEKCPRLHNELPDCMISYKHYDPDIIEDVVDEVVGSDDLGTEDYPCEGTMKHWKWWISQNEANIGGQMRSLEKQSS